MVAKADLEAREAECNSVEDFVNNGEVGHLIGDQDRADGLLSQASRACQTVEHPMQLP